MQSVSAIPYLIFIIILGAGLGIANSQVSTSASSAIGIAAISFVLASLAAAATKVANQWDRLIVLRLGKFLAMKGPGLCFIIPIIDTVPYRIDVRVITTSFKAEKTLTKDTVPVDVDAVLFWKVINPEKAALDVADYVSAISWASQTALRDVIGKTMLSDMLEGREKISGELQKIIDVRTEPWGINVIAVEVKDVLIPPALEDAMSMQAQAERERQARVSRLRGAPRETGNGFAHISRRLGLVRSMARAPARLLHRLGSEHAAPGPRFDPHYYGVVAPTSRTRI